MWFPAPSSTPNEVMERPLRRRAKTEGYMKAWAGGWAGGCMAVCVKFEEVTSSKEKKHVKTRSDIHHPS